MCLAWALAGRRERAATEGKNSVTSQEAVEKCAEVWINFWVEIKQEHFTQISVIKGKPS